MRRLRAAVVVGSLALVVACASNAPSSPPADAASPIDVSAPADTGVSQDAATKGDSSVDAASFVPLSLAPTELQAAIPQREFLLINLVLPTKTLIEGTDLSVASTDTAGLENALQHDKNRKVVFYCMSGKTSKMVMAKLAALGYAEMRDLAGGLMAWQAAGLPVKKL